MSLIDTIISKALEFEGVSESPPGSNNVIFNTDYYGEEVEGEAYPWCVTFLWDVFRMCNASITTMGACFHRDRQAILS